MDTAVKPLYETDFDEWCFHTAELLRAGRLDEIDLDLVAEELEGLARRDRYAVRSLLIRLLLHQIKRKLQPARETQSWRHSITDSQQKIAGLMEDAPSLKRYLLDNLEKIYAIALRDALRETGIQSVNLPSRCPFTLDRVLNDFDLEWPG